MIIINTSRNCISSLRLEGKHKSYFYRYILFKPKAKAYFVVRSIASDSIYTFNDVIPVNPDVAISENKKAW